MLYIGSVLVAFVQNKFHQWCKVGGIKICEKASRLLIGSSGEREILKYRIE